MPISNNQLVLDTNKGNPYQGFPRGEISIGISITLAFMPTSKLVDSNTLARGCAIWTETRPWSFNTLLSTPRSIREIAFDGSARTETCRNTSNTNSKSDEKEMREKLDHSITVKG